MFEKDINEELEFLRNFGLTEEEIEGYLEFFGIQKIKSKRVLNSTGDKE